MIELAMWHLSANIIVAFIYVSFQPLGINRLHEDIIPFRCFYYVYNGHYENIYRHSILN